MNLWTGNLGSRSSTILSTYFCREAVPCLRSRKGVGRSSAVFPVLLGISYVKVNSKQSGKMEVFGRRFEQMYFYSDQVYSTGHQRRFPRTDTGNGEKILSDIIPLSRWIVSHNPLVRVPYGQAVSSRDPSHRKGSSDPYPQRCQNVFKGKENATPFFTQI